LHDVCKFISQYVGSTPRPVPAGPIGQSKRPSPQGSRNKATIALEKLMEGGAEAIVQAVVDAAANGDIAAARLVLDRVVPVRT
jgi:hypothetical protein